MNTPYPFAPPQAQPMTATEPATAFSEAFGAHARPHDVYDVEEVFGPGRKPIPKIAIRAPTIKEQADAIRAAHAALANDIDAVKTDPDALDNEKQIEILFRACRDATNPNHDVFPGSKWMRANLTTEQLAALLNLLGVTRRKHGPGGLRSFEPEEVDMFARQLQAAESGDAYAVLARLSHVDLSGLALVLAAKYVALTGELQALQPLRDSLAAEMAEDRKAGEAPDPAAEG